jgi:Uma2 family endonuclease
MAADPPRRHASDDDVRPAAGNVVSEVLNGDLYIAPRPAGPDAEAASVLGMDVGSAFHRGRGGPGGWIVLFEPELHLARDILVPNLAGWLRSRLPTVPATPFLELAPDWACEVVSPGSERIDRECKLPIYARERVSHVWLVAPLERMIEVYRLDGDGYRLVVTRRGTDRVRLEPFAAIEIELEALWPTTPSEPKSPMRIGSGLLNLDAADDTPAVQALFAQLKAALPELEKLLHECSAEWGYEDPVYRFYHQSFKVYALGRMTKRIVSALQALAPEQQLNDWFLRLVSEGTDKTFDPEHNRRWLEVTRPIIEAFFHARYFLEMAVTYGQKLKAPPRMLPSGWAALLYLYRLR